MNPPKPLIVIVEDEKELAKLIAGHLKKAEMNTLVCHSAAHALRYLERNFANLLLLDLALPDSDGFSLLEKLTQQNVSIPTIFLTGSASEIDIIRGLEMGGDDYITKPFSYAELVARIQAVLRRTETADDQLVTKNASLAEDPFEFCGATVNPQRLEITFPNGNVVKIGRKDFGILSFLYTNRGRILTRKSLIHAVWGIHADVTSRSLDQYIVKIRDSFTQNNCALSPFSTIHGVGYLYDPDAVNDRVSS